MDRSDLYYRLSLAVLIVGFTFVLLK